MKIKKIEEELEIPKGVQITIEGRHVTIKGPKGEIKKDTLTNGDVYGINAIYPF